jgi:RNA polymerase sigma factor (TIGR02999 family)
MGSISMAQPRPDDITAQLRAVRDGGRREFDALFDLVYDRLKRLAQARLGSARADTLNATGLVHEAYLRFVDDSRADWKDRQHFFASAARAMRHILVDHARRRTAQKRGGHRVATTLDEDHATMSMALDDVLAVDAALAQVGDISPRLVPVVEACFFAGLTIPEAAETLGVSESTVKRDWQKARLLLRALLDGSHPDA